MPGLVIRIVLGGGFLGGKTVQLPDRLHDDGPHVGIGVDERLPVREVFLGLRGFLTALLESLVQFLRGLSVFRMREVRLRESGGTGVIGQLEIGLRGDRWGYRRSRGRGRFRRCRLWIGHGEYTCLDEEERAGRREGAGRAASEYQSVITPVNSWPRAPRPGRCRGGGPCRGRPPVPSCPSRASTVSVRSCRGSSVRPRGRSVRPGQ